MDTFSLSAETRELKGKKVRQLRAQDKIPAVLYGAGAKSQALVLDFKPLSKVLDEASESTLIDLAVAGGKPVKVLAQEIQRHPLTGAIQHVDFRQVNMKEKLEAEIELEFVGEAPAVKEKGGILVKHMDAVSVYCLPQDLVSSISVDLTGLKEIDDVLRVSDLPVPSGVEITNDQADVVVGISQPISQEELDSMEKAPEAPDMAAVEQSGEENKEESKAEGAAEGK